MIGWPPRMALKRYFLRWSRDGRQLTISILMVCSTWQYNTSMSITITSHQDARRVWMRAALCYICGEPLPILDLNAEKILRNSPDVNKDHVPPQKLFAPTDRAKTFRCC